MQELTLYIPPFLDYRYSGSSSQASIQEESGSQSSSGRETVDSCAQTSGGKTAPTERGKGIVVVVIDVDVDPKALYSFRRDSFKHRSK